MTRRACRTDANHQAIIKALRAVGAFVVDLSRAGDGVLDLLVGFQGAWCAVEAKDGSKPPSARKLTPPQQRFCSQALALGLPVYVVLSPEDAIEAVTGRAVRVAIGGTP